MSDVKWMLDAWLLIGTWSTTTVQQLVNLSASKPNFFLRSSRNRVDLLSYESKPIDKPEQNDWMAEKNLDGLRHFKSIYYLNLLLLFPMQQPLLNWQLTIDSPFIFFSPPVVLLSFFISRFALIQEQIDSITNRSQKKNWSRSTFWHL